MLKYGASFGTTVNFASCSQFCTNRQSFSTRTRPFARRHSHNDIEGDRKEEEDVTI